MQFLIQILGIFGFGFLIFDPCFGADKHTIPSTSFCESALGVSELSRYVQKRRIKGALFFPEFFSENRVLVVEVEPQILDSENPVSEFSSLMDVATMMTQGEFPALSAWKPKVFSWRELSQSLALVNLASETWFSLMRENVLVVFIDQSDPFQVFNLFTEIIRARYLSGRSTVIVGRPGLEGLSSRLALGYWFDSTLTFTSLNLMED